jgi:pimeloyl-ACP methyl ester carboxylesterase
LNLLVYDRWGSFGRPLVLLHGLGYDRTMWWPVAAELGDDFIVLAVDLPGHGRSSARDQQGLDWFTHDLAMLVSRIESGRAPILVGHGESARFAEAFAGRFATQAVITVGGDESDSLRGVPEMYHQFAVARPDPALSEVYRGWPGERAGRHSTAVLPATDRVASARTVHLGDQPFPHLRDPAGFADLVRTVR